MPLSYHPKKGQLLLCDFSAGFKEPEMTKRSRPVIVLSSQHNLVTVVACSTVKPDIVAPHHYLLPRQSMPKTDHFFGKDTWVKGDMIYTVGFHRLELIRVGKASSRDYFRQKFGKDQMDEIHKCVLHGLSLGFLSQHIGNY